jgi:hypothetical protein
VGADGGVGAGGRGGGGACRPASPIAYGRWSFGGTTSSAGREEEIGAGARRHGNGTTPRRLLGPRHTTGDHEGEAARDGQDGAGPDVRAPLHQLPHNVAGAPPDRPAARGPHSRPGGAHC